MRLELVAVAVGPDCFFRLRPDPQRKRHSENVLVHIWHRPRTSNTTLNLFGILG